MSETSVAERCRWAVLAVFVLSSAINYLDRQTLATLAPLLRAEFHLSNAEYGLILTAFSITYAAGAPFAGMLIDRVGLNRAIGLAVGIWSCAGIATGFTRGLSGLVGCRAVLGVSEAAGIPAAGKAIHQYLKPAERALGNAVNQAGVSLGLIAAPPLATWIALRAGWRTAFVATGLLGLLWIPVWLWAARRAGGANASVPSAQPAAAILRDARVWAFVIANALSMVGYSLWTNWTTLYLVDARGLSLDRAKWFAAVPPAAALAGGFAGGWFSLRLISRGANAPAARFRACMLASLIALAALIIPAAPTPALATAAIAASVFAISAFSVNMYTLPLDVFGGARAAFAVSILVSSYGLVQAVVSPLFGKSIDAFGYGPVIAVAAFTPMLACIPLWKSGAVH